MEKLQQVPFSNDSHWEFARLICDKGPWMLIKELIQIRKQCPWRDEFEGVFVFQVFKQEL